MFNFRKIIPVALVAVAAALMTSPAAHASAGTHSETLLFDGGGGEELNGVPYHSFRIPSLVRTASGSLLAFAEGRVATNHDYGNINVVYKRSTDGGATWSGLRQVVGATQATWGNPTAVVDQATGTIWMAMSWCPPGYGQASDTDTTPITEWDQRKVFLSNSTDDGLTWTTPVDMTETLKPKTRGDGAAWVHDAVGPGVGIQTSTGRLVIPAWHRDIYSDDHGATWKDQVITDAATGAEQDGTSEGTVLELADGRLLRNDRAVATVWDTAKRRWVARGTIEDGFTAFAPDPALLDPDAQGSIMRYNTASPSRIVFLNSASTVNRRNMTLRISYDEAKTWPISRQLDDAPLPAWSGLGSGNVAEGGYSSIVKLTYGGVYGVGALVEVNENIDDSATSHRSIVFRTVSLSWILNGATE